MKQTQCNEACEYENENKYFENLEWWMLLIAVVSVVAFVSIVVSIVLCCCKQRRNETFKYSKIVEIVKYQKEISHPVKQQQNQELFINQQIQNPKNVQEIYYNAN
ncbi:Hypothetical_protein [Hexamita inflata]|uniref:Hypothetical_protein n=1 Tax=Hexamita inflata TaxID=28002 RepID=A0AA86U9T5_9EUKA|nr:Hypothetical protein HINF_LOCUS36810 [Hexamita inflata]